MRFELEQGTEAILLPLRKSEPCTVSGCPTLSRYALSIDGSPYAIRCRKHLPENSIQEYWTMRMLHAAQDGYAAPRCLASSCCVASLHAAFPTSAQTTVQSDVLVWTRRI